MYEKCMWPLLGEVSAGLMIIVVLAEVVLGGISLSYSGNEAHLAGGRGRAPQRSTG